MKYDSIEVPLNFFHVLKMTIAFNVHEFLKNRISKLTLVLPKTFLPILKRLSTGPTIIKSTYYLKSITIITITITLYFNILLLLDCLLLLPHFLKIDCLLLLPHFL